MSKIFTNTKQLHQFFIFFILVVSFEMAKPTILAIFMIVLVLGLFYTSVFLYFSPLLRNVYLFITFLIYNKIMEMILIYIYIYIYIYYTKKMILIYIFKHLFRNGDDGVTRTRIVS